MMFYFETLVLHGSFLQICRIKPNGMLRPDSTNILWLHIWDILKLFFFFQGAEPMQVEAPPEENENIEEEFHIVESSSLVRIKLLS